MTASTGPGIEASGAASGSAGKRAKSRAESSERDHEHGAASGRAGKRAKSRAESSERDHEHGAASGRAGKRAKSRAASSERDQEKSPERDLELAGAAIVEGVSRCGADWVVASVMRLVDAWGQLDEEARAATRAAAEEAAGPATTSVVVMLRDLFARDPAEQRSTPLQIVRSLVDAPTAVLRDAGVPGVVRDAFEERAFPDDEYDLAPRTLGDLGDPDLGPQLLVWGLSKAAVLRART